MLLTVIVISAIIAETTAVVGYWPFTKWPKGKFAIPSAKIQGCPESSDFAFEHGQRTFDCEDDDSISKTSVGMHLDIILDSEKDVHLGFCVKMADVKDELTGGDWPSGKYCVYRVGGTCPNGFQEGWILWQDERYENRNRDSGILPDGEYGGGQTKMMFCCKTDGDTDKVITLPRGRPFYLFKYGETCQSVEGTRFQEEFVLWDNDNRGTEKTHGGIIPESGVTGDGDVKLNFCYYTKISYCGDPGIPEFGEVDSKRFTAGSTLKFSCNEGYRLAGFDEITCLTTEKWNSDKPTCKEVHNCEEENGGCEHSCIDIEAGKHRCECESGYTLEVDGGCSDINECNITDISNTCQHSCVNTKGGYHCACYDGYELNPDDRACSDINECRADPPTCEQKCENSDGSYECSCYEGFVKGSPPNTCDDINECTALHPCEHICNNIKGSFSCGCIEGFQLEEDHRTCKNKNPCADNKLNRCDHSQYCTVVANDKGFTCGCDEGYRLNADGTTCDDINECSEETHQCTQTCHDEKNGYRCSCKPGFFLHSDGFTCLDIDECECDAGTGCGGCAQKCINTEGSYYCLCNPKYVPLKPDSTKCVIPYTSDDPCRTSNCINMQYAECQRIDSTETQCNCKPGYYFNNDKTNCIKGYCEQKPCNKGEICQEQASGRICLRENVTPGPSNGGTDSSSNLMIILITVFVVILWFCILAIVIMVIKRRRSKKSRQRFSDMQNFGPMNTLPHTLPTNHPSALLDNPIYRANSTYNSNDQDHQYEELDKLGYRRKKFASNSYDQEMPYVQGTDLQDDGEAYSYAVTPGSGPPPPTHLLPPPPQLPANTAPEYV